MPFQIGNEYGGKHDGNQGGRPSNAELAVRKTAAEIVKRILDKKASVLAKQYIKRALGEQGDRVLCHAIDKILPPVKNELSDQSIKQAIFVQFNNNSLQLPPEALPATVLASDGAIEGDKECGDGMASEIGEGQDSPKFLHFEDVPGKCGR